MLNYIGVIPDKEFSRDMQSLLYSKIKTFFTIDVKEIGVKEKVYEFDSHNFFCFFTASEEIAEARFSTLPNKAWLALGDFFQKNSQNKKEDIIRSIVNGLNKIEESKGAWISKHYWGNYVLIISHPDNGKTYIFKDPSGLSNFFLSRLRLASYFHLRFHGLFKQFLLRGSILH